ncbi:MAG: hypothetical protein ACRDPD_26410 [Streptosporangiaceae bacterium]
MRRPWLPAARTVAAVIAAGVLALLTAACGGSPSSAGSGGSPNAGGSANFPSAVAYSACMRSHGVPDFPDPGSGGAIPKADAQQLGVSSSQFSAAQQACQRLLPASGGSLEDQAHQCMVSGVCPQALVQQMLTAQRQFARCMRSRGEPNFPDPTLDSQGRPVFVWSISKTGMNPNSAQFQAKEAECQRLGGLGGPREISS